MHEQILARVEVEKGRRFVTIGDDDRWGTSEQHPGDSTQFYRRPGRPDFASSNTATTAQIETGTTPTSSGEWK